MKLLVVYDRIKMSEDLKNKVFKAINNYKTMFCMESRIVAGTVNMIMHGWILADQSVNNFATDKFCEDLFKELTAGLESGDDIKYYCYSKFNSNYKMIGVEIYKRELFRDSSGQVTYEKTTNRRDWVV